MTAMVYNFVNRYAQEDPSGGITDGSMYRPTGENPGRYGRLRNVVASGISGVVSWASKEAA
jgi:hypothetical protein